MRRTATIGLFVGGALAIAAPAFAVIDTPGSGTTVTTATPTVSGDGPVGSLITVTVQTVAPGPVLPGCAATTAGNGRWSCAVTRPLAPGSYNFIASQNASGVVTVSTAANVNVAPVASTASAAPTQAPGIPGLAGLPAVTSTTGRAGTTGLAGTPGPSGAPGIAGTRGPSGARGIAGTPGPTSDVAGTSELSLVAPTADVASTAAIAPTATTAGGHSWPTQHDPRPSQTELPVTSASDGMPYLTAGVVLLIVGGSLVVWMRHRRRVDNQ